MENDKYIGKEVYWTTRTGKKLTGIAKSKDGNEYLIKKTSEVGSSVVKEDDIQGIVEKTAKKEKKFLGIFEEGGEIITEIRFTENDLKSIVEDKVNDYPYYSVKSGNNYEIKSEANDVVVAVFYTKKELLKLHTKDRKSYMDFVDYLHKKSYIKLAKGGNVSREAEQLYEVAFNTNWDEYYIYNAYILADSSQEAKDKLLYAWRDTSNPPKIISIEKVPSSKKIDEVYIFNNETLKPVILNENIFGFLHLDRPDRVEIIRASILKGAGVHFHEPYKKIEKRDTIRLAADKDYDEFRISKPTREDYNFPPYSKTNKLKKGGNVSRETELEKGGKTDTSTLIYQHNIPDFVYAHLYKYHRPLTQAGVLVKFDDEVLALKNEKTGYQTYFIREAAPRVFDWFKENYHKFNNPSEKGALVFIYENGGNVSSENPDIKKIEPLLTSDLVSDEIKAEAKKVIEQLKQKETATAPQEEASEDKQLQEELAVRIAFLQDLLDESDDKQLTEELKMEIETLKELQS